MTQCSHPIHCPYHIHYGHSGPCIHGADDHAAVFAPRLHLPGPNLKPHGARPVHLIIKMIKWIRTSRFLLKNSLSQVPALTPYMPKPHTIMVTVGYVYMERIHRHPCIHGAYTLASMHTWSVQIGIHFVYIERISWHPCIHGA